MVLKRKIISLLFLDVVTKELQKKFPKVTNSFQIETSILTTILVGAREKSTTKNYLGTLTNGQSRQGNTQKYQFYQQKKYTVIYLLNLVPFSHSFDLSGYKLFSFYGNHAAPNIA